MEKAKHPRPKLTAWCKGGEVQDLGGSCDGWPGFGLGFGLQGWSLEFGCGTEDYVESTAWTPKPPTRKP